MAIRKEKEMKKKLIVALLVAAMAVSVTACGKGGNESTQATQAAEQVSSGKRSGQYELDLEKLVTVMPEYSAIELDIDSKYEVNDAAKNNYLNKALLQFGADAYRENTDRNVVEDGDYVKVDYTGYKDDVAFEGGAATDTLIDVTNNCAVGGSGFIEGFTSGIIGAKVGDTVKCPVTFPEQYQRAELAGQDVVFEFVIKGIYTTEMVTIDELSDEKVNEIFGKAEITTNAKLNEQLTADIENELYNAKVSAVKDYMLANATIEVPEDYFNTRLDEYLVSLEKDYATGTQTLQEVVEASGGGYTYDDYLTLWKDNLTTQIKVEILFGRIAQLEGLEVDDEAFKTYVSYIMSQGNGTFTDEQAVFEYFGAGNADEGKAYLQNQYLVNKAVDLVADNVTPHFVDKAEE